MGRIFEHRFDYVRRYIVLEPKLFLEHVNINKIYKNRLIDWLRPWRLKSRPDILIVVDEEISTTPLDSFGIATVIELLRNAQVGCMRFNVDIALRDASTPAVMSNPGPTEPKYVGFRFNMTDGGTDVIDKYEQIWCFGFKPNNSGSSNDAIIDQAFAMPASDAELIKLDSWMKVRQGGLFGTGDHHFLGASMCRRIPRLGTMRRWTNADGVPPQFSPARIDTLRPPSPAYEPGAPGGPAVLDNDLHQGDLTVQPIQWVPWQTVYGPIFTRKRPHPVLCHPTLGPINVMPDHAHEGLIVESPNLAAPKKFNGEMEYPDAIDGGPKPEPEVIAYGSNLGHPPYNFRKLEQPARSRNPMISVYDGHRAGVGRVATDSTWHHWMDVNIDALKAADNDDWKKISRYFINLAVWLNPPGYSTDCFYLSVVASHLQYPGFQEYRFDAPILELGKALKSHLILHYGPCWVTEIIWRLVYELEIIPIKRLFDIREKLKDFELAAGEFEEMVLGQMVQATLVPALAMKGVLDDDTRKSLGIKEGQGVEPLPEPEKLFRASVEQGIKSFVEQTEHCARSHEILANGLQG
jgi:hypothetical protein